VIPNFDDIYDRVSHHVDRKMIATGSETDPRPEELLENFRRRREIGLLPGHVKFPVPTKRFMLQHYRPCDALSQVTVPEGSPEDSQQLSPRNDTFQMSPRNQSPSPGNQSLSPQIMRRTTLQAAELAGDSELLKRIEHTKSAADKKRDAQRAELHSWVTALREQRERRKDVDGEMISRRQEAANTLKKAHDSELKVLQHNRDVKEAEKESEHIRKQLANIARRTATLKAERDRVSAELKVRTNSQNAAAAAANKGVTSLRKQLRQFGDDLFELASVSADTSSDVGGNLPAASNAPAAGNGKKLRTKVGSQSKARLRLALEARGDVERARRILDQSYGNFCRSGYMSNVQSRTSLPPQIFDASRLRMYRDHLSHLKSPTDSPSPTLSAFRGSKPDVFRIDTETTQQVAGDPTATDKVGQWFSS
jgi:hypothetical protein